MRRCVGAGLAVRGLDIWYDQWDSRVGRPVRGMLEKGIEDKEWFVILISDASLASPWVRLEMDVARRLHDEYGLSLTDMVNLVSVDSRFDSLNRPEHRYLSMHR